MVAGFDAGGRIGGFSHDLYANVFRKGASERDELRVSKITVLVLGVVAILLGILFENQNIAFMVGLAFPSPPAVTSRSYCCRCTGRS